jgi:HSP20 family molecular chaperone IbpA
MAENTVDKSEVPATTESEQADAPATREQGRFLVPTVDIYEDEDGLTLKADMPGVESEALDIRVEDRVLTIAGEVSHPQRENPVYREYELAPYWRQFSLGDQVDTENITAELDNGVLTLRLPKAEKARPRRIEVRTG